MFNLLELKRIQSLFYECNIQNIAKQCRQVSKILMKILDLWNIFKVTFVNMISEFSYTMNLIFTVEQTLKLESNCLSYLSYLLDQYRKITNFHLKLVFISLPKKS